MSSGMAASYPISLEVDPAAPQNRLSVLLRIIYVIPHIVVLFLLGIALGVVTLIAWFAILFTGSYPQGMCQFSVGVLRWATRVRAYLFLLTDRYPPFSLEADDSYPVRARLEPRVAGRNRLTVFFRPVTALPQLFVLSGISSAAEAGAFFGWFLALFRGRVKPDIHELIAGEARWNLRATAYLLLLCDEYPPFSLS